MFAVMTGLSGTNFHKQVDLEKSFFGNSQGKPIEFGADQCTAFFLWHPVPCQPFLLRYTRARRCCKGQVTAKAQKKYHHVRSFVPMSAVNLTHAYRTLYESKGLEFNDVGPIFPRGHPITDENKVLLYNFFEDSTATPNQWRLVLNGVSNADNLSDTPTFDETRHASICVEVRYLWLSVSFHPAHAIRVGS